MTTSNGPDPNWYQPFGCDNGCDKMYGDIVDGKWKCRRCAFISALGMPQSVKDWIEAGRYKPPQKEEPK